MPGLLAPNSTHYGPGPDQTFFARDIVTPTSSGIILDTSGSVIGIAGMQKNFTITDAGIYAISLNINLANSPTDVIDMGQGGNGNAVLEYVVLNFSQPGSPEVNFVSNTIKATTLSQASDISGITAIAPPLDYTSCAIVPLVPGNYTFNLRGYTSNTMTNTWKLTNILFRVLRIT